MFENLMKFFKKNNKKKEEPSNSKEAAKERLHLVLMQDRANVSVDFLELMKQEIINVIKKYIEVDENAIDVRLTNKENEDGTNGAPALYANIPIINIKEDVKEEKNKKEEPKKDKENIDNNTNKEEPKKDKENIDNNTKKEEKPEQEKNNKNNNNKKNNKNKKNNYNNNNKIKSNTKEVINNK